MTNNPRKTDFDDWIVSTYREVGPFTMLCVLLDIGETRVEPLRSAYLHVVGDELRWPRMVELFHQAGIGWSGAVFYRAGPEGLVEDDQAHARLVSLVRKLHEDRSLIRSGEFFNADGLRLAIEEIRRY